MIVLKGKYKVRDSRVIIDNGHNEVPLLTFIASLGIRVNDVISIEVKKVKDESSTRE